MTSRNMKKALCASVVLNIFLVAGGGTFLWVSSQNKAQDKSRAPHLSVPAVELIKTRSPEVSERVLTELREIALTAHGDFEEARRTRRQAIDITASDDFNASDVAALLEQSRASEIRGRGRLESGAVDVLSRLEAEDRKALATLLSRRRPRGPETVPAKEDAPVAASGVPAAS